MDSWKEECYDELAKLIEQHQHTLEEIHSVFEN